MPSHLYIKTKLGLTFLVVRVTFFISQILTQINQLLFLIIFELSFKIGRKVLGKVAHVSLFSGDNVFVQIFNFTSNFSMITDKQSQLLVKGEQAL